MSTIDDLSQYAKQEEGNQCLSDCGLVKVARRNSGCIYGCLNKFYDLTTAFLSMIDLITDILVMIDYQQKGYDTFFQISLVIIIFAQLSYAFAFVIQTWPDGGTSTGRMFVFIACLPFAPILSFVMYLMANNYRFRQVIEYLCCFAIELETPDARDHVTQLQAWMEEKVYKHIGFILEAAVEAFPQSILQMCAIVYYEEASLLPVVSIMISLLSVASKSFVFSVSAGIDMQTILFYWLCAVTDFFGIFFTVSWVFYYHTLDDVNHETFWDVINVHLISQVWFYKLIVCIVPLATVLTLIIIGIWIAESSADEGCQACIVLLSPITVPFLVLCLSVGLEVSTFIFVAFIVNKQYTSRFPTNNENFSAWRELTRWIHENQGYDIRDLMKDVDSHSKDSYQTPYQCSAAQDRIIRICCVNYCYLKRGLDVFEGDRVGFDQHWHNVHNREPAKYRNPEKELRPADDIFLRNYLSQTENINKCFIDVRYRDIKDHTSKVGQHLYNANAKATNGRKNKKNSKLHCGVLGQLWSAYKLFFDEFGTVLLSDTTVMLLTLVEKLLAPLYLVSRLVGFVFPVVVIVYVHVYDLWNEVDGLQWTMLIIYTALFVTVVGLFCYVAYYSHYQSYILPSADLFPSLIPSSQFFVSFVKDYYYPRLIITPIRDYLVKDIFGIDVGSIVLGYLGELNLDDGTIVLNFKQYKEKIDEKDRNETESAHATESYLFEC